MKRFRTERSLARLCGNRIVFALRRHQDATGAWRQSLWEIRDNLPHGALVDPLSKQPFVYRRGYGSFDLYSAGSNGIDDSGIGDDCRMSPQ